MITYLFPHILRSVVSDVMMLLFLFTLAQPKYKNKKQIWLFVAILIVSCICSSYYYLQKDFTTLTKFQMVLIALICLASKPLFKDTIMQWIFNFITMANAFMAIVVLSYLCRRLLPYPLYTNTAIRFVLFAVLIVIFHRYVKPFYRQAASHWSTFILTVFAFFINLSYLLISGGDIERAMNTNKTALLLMIFLMIVTYITIFLALKILTKEYTLKEEKMQAQTREDLLRVQMNSMQDLLQVIDEADRKNRIESHDRRHRDNTLLELLRQGEIDEAVVRLEQTASAPCVTVKRYCENTTVNAAISYYAAAAHNENILFKAQLDIPDTITIDVLELSIVIGNLLENAIHACKMISNDKERYINFTFFCNGQLVFEIENPYVGELTYDSNGYPTNFEKDHGLGIKSVVGFAHKHGAQLRYTSENGVFRVRALI